jgi:hypothetical protein
VVALELNDIKHDNTPDATRAQPDQGMTSP